MKKRILFLLVIFLSCVIFFSLSQQKDKQIVSPNGNISLQVNIVDGQLAYQVAYGSVSIIRPSRLGLKLVGGDLGTHVKIMRTQVTSFDKTWMPVWGEEETIRNHYQQLVVDLEEQKGNHRKFSVIFRAYNDGIAFRYSYPRQKGLGDFTILEEKTEFALNENDTCWSIPYSTKYYEGLFTPKPLQDIGWVSTPVTIKTKQNFYLAIHEADLTDYAAMNLFASKGSNVLKSRLTPWSTGERVKVTKTRKTPWRTVIIARCPGDLILSRMMLNLNEPNKIKDTSWITPQRYIGVWWAYHMGKKTWTMGPKHGATTYNVKRYIDFAAKHHFGGVLVEGWNEGWEDFKFNYTKAYSDFDMPEISAYCKQKKIGLIGHHETGANAADYEDNLDAAFAYYQKYGVNVVKTGYVGERLNGIESHSGQYAVNHYRKVIETAARYHIMIDNHEPVMPTGLQRTFPNLMTQEGVRGQEWNAWSLDGGNPPSHTCIFPFTRGLAGPTDFTPGVFSFVNEKMPQTKVSTTLAKQLALSVVIYTPLQMACDMIEHYKQYPDAFSFITSCPTNWSKTVIPEAQIGKYITIARRDIASPTWYVGSITNEKARISRIKLDFLDKKKTYEATIYADGLNADYQENPTDYAIQQRMVCSADTLQIPLARSGGVAIIIKPNK